MTRQLGKCKSAHGKAVCHSAALSEASHEKKHAIGSTEILPCLCQHNVVRRLGLLSNQIFIYLKGSGSFWFFLYSHSGLNSHGDKNIWWCKESPASGRQ